MDNSSGVGVLDKAALVLAALEPGPATLAGLVASTGLARPTAHRLATALEHHRLVGRDLQGRFVLGPRLNELAAAAGATVYHRDEILPVMCSEVVSELAGGGELVVIPGAGHLLNTAGANDIVRSKLLEWIPPVLAGTT